MNILSSITVLYYFLNTLSQLSLVYNRINYDKQNLNAAPQPTVVHHPVYIFGQKEVEDTYIEYITTILKWKHVICNLEKHVKTTLCENIFNELHYKRLNIFLNKTAVFVNNLKCVTKPVRFKSKILLLDEIVMQSMYPCYGRHYPVHTDYMNDDYYIKFYVSSSFHRNSILVYECDYESCYVYNSIENINVRTLSTATFTIKDISYELNFNRNVIFSSNQKGIEHIYIHERDNIVNDPLCNLEIEMKMSLCKFIFNHNIYESFLWITLNKTAFSIMPPYCTTRIVDIQYLHFLKNNSKNLKNTYFFQTMFSCYSQSRIVLNNVLNYNDLLSFSISSGPRKNSILVYHKLNRSDKKYHLFQLIENLHIDHLKPLHIEVEETKKKPSTTLLYNKLRETIELKKEIESTKLDETAKNAIEGMENRRHSYIQKLKTKRYAQKEEILFVTSIAKILKIIGDNKDELPILLQKYTTGTY